MRVTVLPDPWPPPVAWAPVRRLVPAAQAPLPFEPPAPAALDAPRGAPPDPSIVSLVAALVEVAAGRRRPAQLTRWAEEEVVAGAAARARAGMVDLTLRSVRVQRTRGHAEVAARLTGGGREHALAVALERRRERWHCVAAQWGPFRAAPAGSPTTG